MSTPRLSAAAIVVAGLLAACSAAPASTPRTAAPTTAATATASAAATATATPTATPVATSTPTPTLAPTPPPLPSPQAIDVLWEAHGPVTDKTSTAYIAINPLDGNVWVGVPFENLFWIFSPDGEYLESWGESGTGDGQFDFSDHAMSPDGFAPIAFGPDGSFVVGDTGNSRVQVFDAERNFVREWGSFGTSDGQFVQISSIATDGTTVYVGDGDLLKIQAFGTDGNYLRTLGEEGGFFGVAVDHDGAVHATNPEGQTGDPQAMAIFDSNGTELARTVLGIPPTAEAVGPELAIDDAGNSYVQVQPNSFPWTGWGVVEIDPTGKVSRMSAGGGDCIAVTPAGDALYASQGFALNTFQWTFLRKYALPVS